MAIQVVAQPLEIIEIEEPSKIKNELFMKVNILTELMGDNRERTIDSDYADQIIQKAENFTGSESEFRRMIKVL